MIKQVTSDKKCQKISTVLGWYHVSCNKRCLSRLNLFVKEMKLFWRQLLSCVLFVAVYKCAKWCAWVFAVCHKNTIKKKKKVSKARFLAWWSLPCQTCYLKVNFCFKLNISSQYWIVHKFNTFAYFVMVYIQTAKQLKEVMSSISTIRCW